MTYGYLILALGVTFWLLPFLRAHQRSHSPNVVNRRARWGMVLQALAYSILWQDRFWTRALPGWRAALSIVLWLLAALLSWTSAQTLAGQFRIDAALGPEHRLVRSGPYGVMRNPIYTSMLLVLSATAVVLAPGWLFLLALSLFGVGTEIRVRTEEKLLNERFGEEFQRYKQEVPAYLPYRIVSRSHPTKIAPS
ncbi:MAG: isoprenylcysteine carboxylmethyltransferase family protein [Acidobacteria bacterium]|nr:isoprenylcysteine carboxylmethyltransferase family protein [Acidobacteriota bacterium]